MSESMRKIKGVLTVKRFLAVLLMMFAVLPSNSAYSKIIRDAELGQPYEFEDTAEVRLLDFKFVNKIATTANNYSVTCARDQEIALLKAEITNLHSKDFTFNHNVVSVMASYDNKITYSGIAGQYSFAKPDLLDTYYDFDRVGHFLRYVNFGPMYSREFAFYCFLPKRVVNDKKSPLQMIIRIGDDELTYSIRK